MNAAFGRYRLLERLGQGGMAEVFKAKSYGVEGFEKVLVIKRILPELARSQEFVDMFIREAKLSVRLSHANIVQVFDLGLAPVVAGSSSTPDVNAAAKVPDAYYIAMEYVHGFDLATLLHKCKKLGLALSLNMCVFIAAEVTKGLDHAHRRRDEQLRPLGIVHCDVSPQNVLLSFEGEVKVTDFGIAKARGVLERREMEDTHSQKLRGKFGYMSPEHARGEIVDARSDLFSLGTILYECVTGTNPFDAPTTFETLRRVQACEYPPAELLRPDIPRDLIQILQKAMAKDPDHRFADAGKMYEALLAFLYTQGERYSAHDLAEFVARFRGPEILSVTNVQFAERLALDAAAAPVERTPVEVPARTQSSASKLKAASVPHLAVERAVGLGERREVTALVIELPHQQRTPRGEPATFDASERASEIFSRYGGRVVKRDPAQIAALFGLGEADGRDTEVATRCALVALRALDAPSRPSAGIHTGRIHVANDGEPTEDDRLKTLISTARELARVREGRCAISSTAMRQVKTYFEFEPLADADTPVATTSGVLVKEVRGAAETFGRFVGRKEELRTIGEVLAMTTRRTLRLLTIRGDHGMGKTRLLYEVERRLRKGNYSVGFHIAVCPPRGAEFPLSGIVCMLHVLCGTNEGDAPERILALQPRLRALGLNSEEVNAVLSSLGAHVAAPSVHARATLRHAFAKMVASLCEDRPHTFAWDAAHGMDEESFALLADTIGRLPTARVLFAFAGRAGFSHRLEKMPSHSSLNLADLDPRDVERLIGLRLGVDQVPDELVRFVRERAGGHPLFVEEVLKALVDSEAVTLAERRVVTMRLVGQEFALPKTLRGLVASRVNRLSKEHRSILQAAAVLGDPVDVAVLAELVGQPVFALERTLEDLEPSEFLVRTAPSELRFQSPIVPEVILDALTPEASREMHAAAGQAMQSVLGDRAFEQASRIAMHLYEAGERDQAATFFAKSGERRLEARQMEAATRDFARAIALSDLQERPGPELAGWLAGLAAAVRLVRLAPEAPEMCERVIARLDAVGDEAVRVRARVDAGHVLVAVHMFDAARQRFAEAEKIANGDEGLLKTVLIASAEQATRQGDFKRSNGLLERLQRIVSDEGDASEQHKVLLSRAQAFAGSGERGEALKALERAELLLPLDATAASERQKMRVLISYFSGDMRAAAAECERAVDMARRAGLTYEVMANLHNLGDVLTRLNDYPRAYGAIQQSLALCDECGYDRLGSLNRMFLAYLDGVAGAADAVRLLSRGISYAEANDFTWDVLSGRLMLAQLLQRRGDLAAARTEFERVRELAQNTGNKLVVDDCNQALGAL